MTEYGANAELTFWPDSLTHFMQIVSLGHDEKMFDTTSRPFLRQASYAALVAKLTIVMPTPQSRPAVHEKNVTIEAVAAKWLPVRFFVYVIRCSKVIRQQKVLGRVVVTAQNPFEFGLVGWFMKVLHRVPLEVQVHGDFYSREFWREESVGNNIRYHLGLFVLRRADGVRVVGQRIAASLTQRGVTATKITVLPISTSLAPFLTATPRPLWSSTDALTIISVARFSREKNLPLLIRAFKRVYDACPQTQLVLVGEGSGEAELHRTIATLWPTTASPVLMYPWQSDIASVMKAADLYALTSDYEGYAMVLGEAMAAGLPIVSTDVGCVGDLCLPDTHALVVPPRDEAALVTALTKLVADAGLRTRLSAAGLATAQNLDHNDTTYPTQIVAGWQRLLT